MNGSMRRRVKVLIVDDSALVRQALTSILGGDPEIEVIGAAQDPYAAVALMKLHTPDVITLDIEMPRMDGITFLQRIMSQHPIPVIICSTLTSKGSDVALDALDKGAVEIIAKPKLGASQFLEESAVMVCDTVKAAARSHVAGKRKPQKMTVAPKLTADAILLGARPSQAMIQTTEKVVVVGASTGGTEALREFLQGMPLDAPGIVIVQHMPEEFTARFAERLNSICRITVKEARNNDTVIRGQALIAPGSKHMLLKRSGARYMVELRDGPLVCRHRPSVDVLFRSAARYGGSNVVGVIMTGMGDDGARGMLEMKQAGAFNIAQDEATCVVFGMPAEAIKTGAVDRVMPLRDIGPEISKLCR